MSFDISTATPVLDTPQGPQPGGQFDIESARPVQVTGGDKNPQTEYEKFQQSERDTVMMSQQAEGKVKEPPVSGEDIKAQAKYPSHSFLNHPIAALGDISNLTGDVLYSTFGKPLGLAKEASEAVTDEEAQLSKDHPVGAILAGTAPFIVTAPLFPSSLLGLIEQFATVSGLSELGKQRMDESLMKPIADKLVDVVRETSKGALMGPIWHYSGALKFIANPVAASLVRAGIRGVGTATLDKVYGSDLASAFKDGSVMFALSTIFESPYLAKTVLGRGIIERTNKAIYEGAFGGEAATKIAQTSEPTKINPDSSPSEIQQKVLNAANTLATQIKGVNPPPGTVTDIDNIIDWERDQQDGGKIVSGGMQTGSDRVVTSAPSGHSEAMQHAAARNGSYEKVYELLKRYQAGEKLTELQTKDVNDILADYGRNKKDDIDSVLGPVEVQQARKQAEAIPHTDKIDTPEREALRQSIADKFYGNGALNKNRRIDLVLGIPAAGKGNFLENISKKYGSLDIDNDRYKEALPEYAKGIGAKATHKESEFIESKVINRAAKAGDNMAIAWLGKNPQKINDFIDWAKEAGYEVHVTNVDLPSEKAAGRAITRFQETGRFVDPQYIKEIGLQTRRNNDKLASDERLASYAKYSTDVPKGNDPVPVNAAIGEELGGSSRRSGQDIYEQIGKDYLSSQESNLPKIVNPETLKGIAEGEEGKLDISLIPGVPEVADALQNSHAELKEKFAPYNVGQEGPRTAQVLRENLGLLARANDRLENSLLQAKKIFDKATKESSLQFIYNMEEGKAQETPELQKISDTVRNILDSNRDEVIGLGTGKLENWIENYFPHVWEKPGQVISLLKRVMGRRPFEGTKSFLKRRTIPTTREGIDLGFTPLSYNPIDSVMLKVREMQRYIMAHRTIQALKEQGIIKFVRDGHKAPDGWVKIDDRYGEVRYKNEAKETVLAGKYMIQPDAGRILNNYLSPGLRGKSFIYDMYRGAGNTLNQFQLGISAFHLGFTSMDATISKFALGLNKLSTGNFAGAIKEFAKAPFAPITNILQGRQLLQSWYGKDNGELTNNIADLLATAGGRAKMDKFYATGIKESMEKSIKEGKLATAAFKVPFYIVEQMSRPIMEYIVPRQKMGVFMDMMKMELERNPDISHEQMRVIAQKAWDSVDNRMGQLVYDNLFWNRTTKDLAMASVRSLGWNLGTVREIGGGVKDVVGNVDDVIHGRASKMSYRTAYVMALPIVTGLYGAIYQYLHTGSGPQELKDYFFPKNGAIDNKGQAARISLPTYMKDIYHYTTNPVQTVINKFSPVNNAVLEMLNNKDYYGVEIRNVDDPVIQQIIDESKFVASQFEPFGFRNLGRDTRTSAGSKVEPFIGIIPAPYDVNMTPAEREAWNFEKQNIPPGARTKAQAEHSQAKAKLRNDYMASEDKGPLEAAVEAGTISVKEKNAIVKDANMTSLERLTKTLTFEQVNHLMKVATPDEKEELEQILEKKRSGKKQRGTWTQEEQDLYDKTFNTPE